MKVRGPLDGFVRLRDKANEPSVQPIGTPPATVDGGYGRVPAAPVDFNPPPAAPKMSPKDAERLAQAEIIHAMQQAAGALTEVTARLGGRQGAVNGVLAVRLVALDADGRWTYTGQVTVGSAVVENHHASAPLYVVSGDSWATPGAGTTGARMIAAGQERRMPIGGRTVSILGTPGTLVSVQFFTGLQPYGVAL